MYIQKFEQNSYKGEVPQYITFKGTDKQVEWANDVRRLFIVICFRIDSKIYLSIQDKEKKIKFLELIKKLDPVQAWIQNNDKIKYFKWENQPDEDIKKEFFQICRNLCLTRWEVDELPDFEGWF